MNIEDLKVGECFYNINEPNIVYEVSKIDNDGVYLTSFNKKESKTIYLQKYTDALYFEKYFYSDYVKAMIGRARILVEEAEEIRRKFFPDKKESSTKEVFQNLAQRAFSIFSAKK